MTSREVCPCRTGREQHQHVQLLRQSKRVKKEGRCMEDAGWDLSFFGSTHAAQDGIMREEVDCNTYRLEITNKGHTYDGCRHGCARFSGSEVRGRRGKGVVNLTTFH